MKFTHILFIFLNIGYLTTVYSTDCPNGGLQMPQEENICIYLYKNAEYYWNAIRSCMGIGGTMIKIQNIYENAFAFVMTEGLEIPPYIGVERKENGDWFYTDGQPLSYQNWGQNQPGPSGNANDCAVIDPQTGRWSSSECSVARPFFCSIDTSNQTMASTMLPRTTTVKTTTTATTTRTIAKTTTISGKQCPTSWVYNANTTSCYYIQNLTTLVYEVHEAESICQAEQKDAHLASIHSWDEDLFIFKLITDAIYPCWGMAWIGYFGNGTLGTGRWTDGSAVDYFYYKEPVTNESSYWATGNRLECANGWIPCDETVRLNGFVCKKPAQ